MAEHPDGAGGSGADSHKQSIWDRARRKMADHNAAAPSGPMGIPEVPESESEAEPEPQDYDGPTSEIVLERVHHYRDTIRNYHVLIEGQRVGRIRDNGTESFVLRPGSYTLRLQLMWIFSPKVVVELSADTATRLVCGPNGGILQAWRLFFAPTTAIFLRFAQEA